MDSNTLISYITITVIILIWVVYIVKSSSNSKIKINKKGLQIEAECHKRTSEIKDSFTDSKITNSIVWKSAKNTSEDSNVVVKKSFNNTNISWSEINL